MRSEAAFMLGAILVGCVPELDTDESLISVPRVVAIAAEPAEARPNDDVRVTALVLGPDGPIEHASPRWSLCRARFGAAEPTDALPAACIGDGAEEFGTALEASFRMPRDACRLFGPELPPVMAGEVPGRPAAPDVSGGYQQPIRIDFEERVTASGVRVLCGLGTATQEQAMLFRRQYARNQAPAITLSIVDQDERLIGEDPVPTSVGSQVTLRVRSAECPVDADVCGDGVCGPDESREVCAADCAMPRGCSGAERYLRFDPEARALTIDRESLRFAWLTTRGTFEVERTGRASDDFATAADNVWTAPSEPGLVHVAVVVRDARGGVGWALARFDVR